MSDDLKLQFEIVTRDNGTQAILDAITKSLAGLDRQARKTGETLKKALGGDLLAPMTKLKTESKAFGTDLSAAAEKAAQAIRGDVTAVSELRAALRGAIAEQRDLAASARAAQSAGVAAARSQAGAARSAASTRATASRDAVRDVGRIWRVRQASEAAELAHIRKVGREHASQRREAMRSAREAGRHGYHAVRSLNHPVHESLGFALSAGAAAGVGMAEHILRASEAFDTSMTRMRMFAPSLDADAIRKQALGDSIRLGVDASQLVDAIAKSVRDGVPPEIAKTLPRSVVAAAQTMGGNIERLTNSLAEGIQEAYGMGWIKNAADTRRFLNIEAGLSNFAGNSAEKTEQFVAAGGLGHGREMGLDLTRTLAYGALLNSSGMRTGQASARFMGQLSQSIPEMTDRYRSAVASHKNSEQDRAVRSAPRALGYGSIGEMAAKLQGGPEGLVDFSERLNKLDDKQRKLILRGYGFSEQGGAAIAEIGASPAKAKSVLARAKELAGQKEANDYLSDKFREWQTSLSNMLKQIEAGWRAIENEIGDVIKSDIVAPFRDWWVEVSDQITHSNLKAGMHQAILGFVHGLGFEDVRHLLNGLTKDVHGFDFVGFSHGLGVGIREVVDDMRALGRVFGGGDGPSAETIGRVAAEMLGLSLALKAVSPVVSVLSGVVEALRAIGAMAGTLRALAAFAGLTGAAEGVAVAGALLPVSIAAMTLGALAVTVLNWSAITESIRDVFSNWFGGGGSNSYNDTIREHARRAVGDDGDKQRAWIKANRPRDYDSLYNADGTPKADKPAVSLTPSKPELPEFGRKYWEKQERLMHPSSFDGGAESWRDLMVPASYSASDSGDVIRDAVIGTERGVVEVRESIDRLGARLTLASYGGSAAGLGDGGGGGRPSIRYGHPGSALGGALPNMRYGHGATTPGSGQAREIGPHVGLGKMGAKFAAKAPVIMDGLMKKYGLTREQAAGIVGNLGHESAGFTAYHEGGQAPGKGGVGWAQWTGSRRRAFEKWTTAHGLNPTSDEASWRYLTEGDPETAKAILAVKRTTNRRDAVRAWEGSFERAGVKAYGSRDKFADKAFAAEPGGATVTAGKPLGTESNPLVTKPDVKSIGAGATTPDDVVGHLRSRMKPRTGSDDVPAGTSADNSTTNHTWHVYGEPARQAVARHLDSRGSGSTIDLDAFA